eukprot:268649-Rhodomonas_salina.4
MSRAEPQSVGWAGGCAYRRASKPRGSPDRDATTSEPGIASSMWRMAERIGPEAVSVQLCVALCNVATS